MPSLSDKVQLRVPGPTPCPERVLQALGRQMINHRGKEFAQLLQRSTDLLKHLFQTRHDLFLLTASGTGGMEAAVVNTLSPGDRVLAVTNGYFGERFAEMAARYGAEVVPLEFPWDKPADPDRVRHILEHDPAIKAVLITHNETSTGLTNPLAEIARTVKEHDKLLLVDAISSLGALEFPTDQWGVDVAVTASQKAWMAPPGLAMVSVSPQAWRAHAQARMPRYYWDFSLAREFLEKGQTPFTPAVSTIYGLLASLELMAEEGLARIQERHRRVGERIRQGTKALGLPLFPEERFASNTVSAIRVPAGVEVKRLLEAAQAHNTVLAGGQDRLGKEVFRIGHLGWVTEEDADTILEALGAALTECGHLGAAR